MYVLGIDTSTLTGGAAVVHKGHLVGEYVLNIRTTHSERLLPAVEQVLTDSRIALHDIAGIAVVTGPGSFTGIRIGVATAKGFAYALDKNILGVTSMEALGYQFQHFPGLVLALIDSRRGEVYGQAFRQGDYASPAWNCPLEEVLEWTKEQDEACLFVGDGAIAYQERISEVLPQAAFPSNEQAVLRPSSVAGWGYSKFYANHTGDLYAVNPVYLRKTEAEMKWTSRAK